MPLPPLILPNISAPLGSVSTPISIPTVNGGWPGTIPSGVTYSRRASGQIVTNFDPTTLIPSIDIQYYWDPVNGSDANSGLTPQLPKKTLSTILGLTTGNTIGIEAIASADVILRTSASWNNVQPTKNIVLRNRTGFRMQSVKVVSATPATYTVDGTFSNVYSTVISAPLSVVDLESKNQPTITIPAGKYVSVDGVYRLGDGATPITINNAPPVYLTMTKVASLAIVAATPGSWFHDGTNLKVRPYDDRDLTVAANALTIIPTITGNNGRFGAQNNQLQYIEGIDFIGGTPFLASNASSVTGQTLVHSNTSFQGSATNVNGLNVLAFMKIYGYRSGTYYNYNDGFNYHSFENDGVTPGTSPTYYEFECVALGNGTTGSSGLSDNASTSHDFAVGNRVNSLYINSDDGPVIDTNSAQTWELGCYLGPAGTVAANKENIQALITAKQWADNCVFGTSANNNVAVAAGAAWSYTHLQGGAPSNTGPGSLTAY